MRRPEDGYAMVALLVAMAVMAVMLTAAMPVWKTTVQREKEAELIFRGEQYARAIGLFQRKMGPGTMPPSIDLLVEQRYLRKKYKDPITNDDFQILSGAQAAAAQAGQIGGPLGQAQQQLGQAAGRLGQAGGGLGGRAGQPGQIAGGIMGVVSKSTGTSMRLYNNRDKYNEWTFVFVQTAQAAGRGGGGAQRPGENVQPGGRGARGGRGGLPPGGRGNPFGSGAGLGRGAAGPQTAPGGRR
jgi:type II secretory pathway pseudopilin PulG